MDPEDDGKPKVPQARRTADFMPPARERRYVFDKAFDAHLDNRALYTSTVKVCWCCLCCCPPPPAAMGRDAARAQWGMDYKFNLHDHGGGEAATVPMMQHSHLPASGHRCALHPHRQVCS